MRRGWSLFARLAALFALVLSGGQLILLAAYLSNRAGGDEADGYSLPLPARAAAIVALVEGADPTVVLDAVNSDDVSVFVDTAPFEAFEAEPLRVASVERFLDSYDEAFAGRRFAAFIAGPEEVPADAVRLRDRSLWSSYPLRLAIELRDGRMLVIETRGDLIDVVYDLPVGFVAGLISLVGASVVLFALHRETAPLRALAAAARRFGRTGAHQAVDPRGARETRALVEAFDTMQRQVADLIEERTVMLGALGHDLRTHLARLRLRAETAPAPLRADLVRDVERMSAIAENGMAFAAASGKAGAPRDVVALGPLLDDLRDQHPHMRTGSIASGSVLFDEGDLRRVLGNLVDNAGKFAGDCIVSARAAGDRVEIVVEDRGPGVPAHERAAALEPFARPGAARTQDAAGTGLGLAIADLLARRNGGTLTLDETPGGGLTVIVSAERGD